MVIFGRYVKLPGAIKPPFGRICLELSPSIEELQIQVWSWWRYTLEIERKRPLKIAGLKSKGMSRSAGLSFYPLMAGGYFLWFYAALGTLRFPMDICAAIFGSIFPHQKIVMNLHREVFPCEANKSCPIGNDSAMGEGLIELEVIGMSGECKLKLNVADSMLGCELWKMILDKLPSRPGLRLVVSHTSRLVLHQSLQQQGLEGQRAQVLLPTCPSICMLPGVFAHGYSVENAEFSSTGIVEVTGVDDETPALLHNLPQSLRTLTFADGFNRSLDNVTWPADLQCLTLVNISIRAWIM